MRKTIIVVFIAIGLFAAVIIYGPAVSLVYSGSVMPMEIPPGFADDLYYAMNYEPPALYVDFSHDKHFYDETISVSITASNPDAVIYYTTDSSTPTSGSSIYTAPLVFTAGEDVRCHVLKAVAIDSGEHSAVLTHSYFVGETVHERFAVSYVFSVSSEEDGLFGYENGILVPGKIHDDYMAENPDTELATWWRPANYHMRGREWERAAHVEAITQAGEAVIKQDIGLRVNGGATRSCPQKALRLIARREYTPDTGRFNYNFFDYFSDNSGVPVASYDTLILRNFGNDWGNAFIRTPLVSHIAHEAGFGIVSPQVPAAVFINGGYYGYAYLTVRLNEKFISDIYNIPEDSVTILNGGIRRILTNDMTVSEEFNRILEYAAGEDNDTAVRLIEDFYDVDNLLFYFAIECYVDNTDWSNNNTAVWRYSRHPESVNQINEPDGRWRFMLFDVDHSLNWRNPPEQSINSTLNIPILAALLEQRGYADAFTNYMCDLAYEHFSIQNVTRVIQQMDDAGMAELRNTLAHYGIAPDTVIFNRETILSYVERRPAYVLAELQDKFGYTGSYRIISDGTCKINTLNSNEGMYFTECSVPITPKLEKWHVFDHWLVNGEKRYDEDLTVSYEDADETGVVYVSLVTREELPPLVFRDTYDTGDICGFIMQNPAGTAQSTRGLYLSDNIADLKKWAFPAMNISAGNTLEFVGRNSRNTDALLKLSLNFNPREGKVIYLSDDDGVILDYTVMSE